MHIRPLPSDSTTQTVPVSATAKFAPLTPTLADRNRLRRWRRAASASSAGSSLRSPASSSVRRNSSRISARLRWIAGTRMWDCSSSPSCTMSSARSVSCAVMPSAASASFISISSEASDLTFTTSVAPCALTMPVRIALASAPSRAQCTWPPAAWTDASSCSRSSGRRAIALALIAAPASRSASQSATSPTTAARLARIVRVAWPRLRRCWVLASASRAAAGKPSPVTRPPSRRGSRRGARSASRLARGRARRRCAAGTSCPARCRSPRGCRAPPAACP